MSANTAAKGLNQLGPDLSEDPEQSLASPTAGERRKDSLAGQAIALVVDAEVTSYLMMGALSPGLKRHSVTLFEGLLSLALFCAYLLVSSNLEISCMIYVYSY